MLGIEPYLSVNIGSGAVQEAAQWIEYVTAPNGSWLPSVPPTDAASRGNSNTWA